MIYPRNIEKGPKQIWDSKDRIINVGIIIGLTVFAILLISQNAESGSWSDYFWDDNQVASQENVTIDFGCTLTPNFLSNTGFENGLYGWDLIEYEYPEIGVADLISELVDSPLPSNGGNSALKISIKDAEEFGVVILYQELSVDKKDSLKSIRGDIYPISSECEDDGYAVFISSNAYDPDDELIGTSSIILKRGTDITPEDNDFDLDIEFDKYTHIDLNVYDKLTNDITDEGFDWLDVEYFDVEIGVLQNDSSSKCGAYFDNIEIGEDGEKGYPTEGYIVSEGISIPENSLWQNLIISKNEFENHMVEVNILNGTSGDIILGFENLLEDDVDISLINPNKYPNIFLVAIFLGDGTDTPILNFWEINWIQRSPWEDEFFDDTKIDISTNVEIYNEQVEITHWTKRKPIKIKNTGAALSDFQVKIIVDYTFDMNYDFSDLRFVDNDEKTELNYWIEEYTIFSTATVWVKVPSIPNGEKTIYMYYGNPDASSTTDFDDTFTKDFDENGLVGLWHIDEGSGITIIDSSGNGNNGEIKGGTSWEGYDGGQWKNREDVTFSNGDCLYFDGNDDFISVNDNSNLDIINSITISAWIYSLDNNGEHTIVAKGKQYDRYGNYVLYVRGGKFGFRYRDSSDNNNNVYYSDDTSIESNKWYHVCVTYTFNKAFSMKIYVNGILQIGYWFANGGEKPLTTSDPLNIGRANDYNGPRDYFDGLIDEVRIYNRALNVKEIYAQYERRKSISTEQLVEIGTEELEELKLQWYDDNWNKRKPITIGNNGDELTEYQVRINVNYDSDMQNDFDDLRFTKNDGTTEIPHWVEEYSTSNWVNVWVKIPAIPKEGKIIYMYYGNPGVSSIVDFDNTFTKDFDENGLVGLWHMDEGSGTTIIDSSGTGNGGELKGGTSWIGEDGGQWNSRDDINFSNGDCLNFDGNNDYVEIKDDASLRISKDLTLVAWVKTSDSSGDIISKFKDFSGTARDDSYKLYVSSGNASFLIQTNTGSSPNHERVTGTSINDNKWHHVVGTFDGSTLRIYVDGKEENSTSYSGTIATGSGSDLFIGAEDYGNSPYYQDNLECIIDEVRIYNRVLNDEEIITHYERRKYTFQEPTKNIGSEVDKNSKWEKRREIKIFNPFGDLSDYQVKIDVSYDNDMENDFEDLRFTDSDGITLIPYWIEEYISNSKATIWVNIPTLQTGDNTIYMYYSNPSVSSKSNFDNTFTKDFEEDSLVGLWHMDEGVGTIITDSSINGNNGDIKNGVSWIGSDGGHWNSRSDIVFSYGDSLYFDGNNDYIDCGSDEILEITGSYTLSVWTKINTLNDRGTIIAFGGDGESLSVNYLYRITPLTNGDIRIGHEYGNGNDQSYDINMGIITNRWYYLTLVKDSVSKELKLYNGDKLIDTIIYTHEATGGNNGKLWIGRNPGPNDKYFEGIIDEIKIYNRVLSPEEIRTQFERRKYAFSEITTNIESEEEAYKSFTDNGFLISDKIVFPKNCILSSIKISKTEPIDTSIKITILDSDTMNPILGFENLEETEIDISSINTNDYPSIKLQADFYGTEENSPILHDWRVEWTMTPVAWLDAEPIITNIDEDIEFNSEESWSLDSEIIEYKYDFNGEETGWIENDTLIKKYSEKGNYTARIKVKDNNGIESDWSKNITIQIINQLPIAEFTASSISPYTNEDITFNASDSYDFDGEIIEYYYDFGDGNVSGWITESEIIYNYSDYKEYIIRLKVKDNDDDESEWFDLKITVINRPPIVILKVTPQETYIDEFVNFDASLSFDPDGEIISYTFDFGDGESLEDTVKNLTTHKYSTKETFHARAKVFDNENISSDWFEIDIIIKNRIPNISLNVTPTSSFVNSKIHFDANDSIDEDGLIHKYKFDFGDETITDWIADSNVFHNFENPGTYVIKAKVMDNDNDESNWSEEIEIIIKNRAPIAIIANPTNNYEFSLNTEIEFIATGSFDEDGDILTYKWVSSLDGLLSEGKEVSFKKILSEGTHNITLLVTDTHGASDTEKITIVVKKEIVEPEESSFNFVYVGLLIVIFAAIGVVAFFAKHSSTKTEIPPSSQFSQYQQNISRPQIPPPLPQQVWQKPPIKQTSQLRSNVKVTDEEIRIKCPQCENIMFVKETEGPIYIKCNKCGAEGNIGK